MDELTNDEVIDTLSWLYTLSIMTEVLNKVNINKVVFVTEDGTDLSIDNEFLVAMIVRGTSGSLTLLANELEKTLK